MISMWLGISEYISGLGPIAKLVLVILLLFSIATWTIIIYKSLHLFVLNRKDRKILNLLETSRNWRSFARDVDIYGGSYLSEVVKTLVSLRGIENYTGDELSDIAYTSIDVARSRYESFLIFLAIAGSSSPFIGLFGTVWGIMDAFRGIGKVGSASLALVSRGIADALIATACGLFVAIPAVIFYNLFQYFVKKWERRASSQLIKIIYLTKKP